MTPVSRRGSFGEERAHRFGRGWACGEVDRAREDGVDRRTAKLMFADRDRMSAMRSEVPQT